MVTKGTITENELMMKLVQAKKVLNKVDGGNYERGHINETILRSDPEDIDPSYINNNNNNNYTTNVSSKKIMESKLPDAIKKAMIDTPIPQISLNDSLNLDFVKNTKKLMEAEGVRTSNTPSKSNQSNNVNFSMKELTPLIENIVRKTVTEVLDSKLTQILTAQQTISINENLVLKVGDSIFKGKITGVNKSK
jgi:hypothetical protein